MGRLFDPLSAAASDATDAARGDGLIGVRRELHRIGVNINQIARALNTAVMEGSVLNLEIAQIAAFAAEIRGHLCGLDEAFAGNLAYWSAEP